ncbi:unnamed protein product, partial [Ectocarpus sp. 12 AP-2014]
RTNNGRNVFAYCCARMPPTVTRNDTNFRSPRRDRYLQGRWTCPFYVLHTYNKHNLARNTTVYSAPPHQENPEPTSNDKFITFATATTFWCAHLLDKKMFKKSHG